MKNTVLLLIVFVFSGLCKVSNTGDHIVDAIHAYWHDITDVQRIFTFPYSDTARALQEKAALGWRDTLVSLKISQKDISHQIDKTLLEKHIAQVLLEISEEAAEKDSILAIIPFVTDIEFILEKNGNFTHSSIQKTADLLEKTADRAEVALRTLKASVKEKQKGRSGSEGQSVNHYYADLSTEVLRKSTAQMKHWYTSNSSYYPTFAWWVKKAWEKSDSICTAFQKFLEESVVGKNDESGKNVYGMSPYGIDKLRKYFSAYQIGYDPETLLTLAKKDLDWCIAQRRDITESLGFGDDWGRALDSLKGEHASAGKVHEQIDTFFTEVLSFVRQEKLCPVPENAAQLWRTTFIDHETQKRLPFAAYQGYRKRMLIAFSSGEMEPADKVKSMHRNNRYFLRNIFIPHELIPGHHLHFYFSDRSRLHRSYFKNPVGYEGWAFYWEMQLFDRGYAKSKLDSLAFLFWRGLRCARVITTIKYHQKKMVPEEMIAFLTEKIGLEETSAKREVQRYITMHPLYQLSYFAGAHQFYSLYKDFVESGILSAYDFHKMILLQNLIPPSVIQLYFNRLEKSP